LQFKTSIKIDIKGHIDLLAFFYTFTPTDAPMKKAIYTVITNNYDALRQAPNYKGWDCVLFTDNPPADNKGWIIRKIETSTDPVLTSRKYKILSHVYLSEYDLVCYIDANQKMLKEPPSQPIRFTHPRRQNIFQEAHRIIKNGRFSAEQINAQITYYKKQGYKDAGLFLNGFSVRSNTDEKINHLHDIWYVETSRFSPRDQLSLPYAIWKTGIKLENIHGPRTKVTYATVSYDHNEKKYTT